MKTKKLIIKADQEMGIIEVLRTMPESIAFVFQAGQQSGNSDYFMKLGDPVFTPDDTKYVSVLNVMGYNRERRELWFGPYYIPRGKELKTCTNKQLLDMLEETARLIDAEAYPDMRFQITTLKNFTDIGLTKNGEKEDIGK